MKEKKVLAIDLGASGGRATVCSFDGARIDIQEIHRFANDPVIVNGTMYWDVLRLYYEIKQSLLKAKQYAPVESISVDTWGVDFGLLDRSGNLIANPVHYRDGRTRGILAKALQKISGEELYAETGIQFMEINTAFQLMAAKEGNPKQVLMADTLLMMPDLFHYFLSGEKAGERSIASTTQLLNPVTRQWSDAVIRTLDIPERLLPRLVDSGTVLGSLSQPLCRELGILPMQVIAGAGHDTQSAMAAVPAGEENYIFLSCGTWCLVGTELDSPVVSEQSLRYNLTNEIGYGNKTAFLKNISGLWLIQESRRQWIREGKEFTFGELDDLAVKERPFQCLIDPDDPVFTPAGDIPGKIRDYCRKTGQPVPEAEGTVVRCIYESLALKYRMAVEEIESCTGKNYETIYMVGGGTHSKLLCQITADACGCRVSAGPSEAAVLGNAFVQMIALGLLPDLAAARRIIGQSREIKRYEPGQNSHYEDAYQLFRKQIEVMRC